MSTFKLPLIIAVVLLVIMTLIAKAAPLLLPSMIDDSEPFKGAKFRPVSSRSVELRTTLQRNAAITPTTTSPMFIDTLLFGDASDQEFAALAFQDSNMYVAGLALPSRGILFNYDRSSQSIKWEASTTDSMFFRDIIVMPDRLLIAGAHLPPTCGATDGVGGTEQKSGIALYSTTGERVSCRSEIFFPYRGYEQYFDSVLNVTGESLYAVGGAQIGFPPWRSTLAKYDLDGNVQWKNSYGSGSYLGSITNAAIWLNGYLFVAGYDKDSEQNNGEYAQTMLLKVDASAVTSSADPVRIWQSHYDYGSWSGATAMVTDGTYLYLTGYVVDGPAGKRDVILSKYDQNVNPIWSTTWGASEDDLAWGIAIADSYLYITGETSSCGAQGKDLFIARFDPSDGKKQFVQLWGGVGEDKGEKIVYNPPYLYIGGETDSVGAGGKDIVILTYDPATSSSPPKPSNFYGSVLLDGANVPDDSSISAWIDGLNMAATTSFTTEDGSVYRIDVPGDIPTTPEKEGGDACDIISFRVQGDTATETAPWISGVQPRLDLTATSTNQPPISKSQTVSTVQEVPVMILLEATDVDNDALTFEVVTSPTNGKLTDGARNITYTPEKGFFGTDSFTFKANDGKFDSNIATVIIDVGASADSEAPRNPTNLHSTSHEQNTPSSQRKITVEWSNNAQDNPNGSGIAGYSTEWSRESDTWPDESVDWDASITSETSAELPSGDNFYFHLRTCDKAGNCSDPVHHGPFAIDASPTWTMLIYAVADNNLHPWMGDNPSLNGMLYRLKKAGPAAHVKVAILYDGPGLTDTYLYTLTEDGTFTQNAPDPVLGAGVREARMDEMVTLRDFVRWGLATFESDYYYLALLDHANGVVGLGDDRSSDPKGKAYLKPDELHNALLEATTGTGKRINVLHYDGCSFGLFENTSIAEGTADYVIASPNTGWAVFGYDTYRANASLSPTPGDLAQAVAQNYAEKLKALNYPYTISVFDMARFSPMKAAIGMLADELKPLAKSQDLIALRDQVQTYDSDNNLYLNKDDRYIDLYDLANSLVKDNPLKNNEVVAAANGVLDEMTRFVIHKADWHATGSFIEFGRVYTQTLDRVGGIGIYYPASQPNAPSYQDYVSNKSFPVTDGWGWIGFVGQIPNTGANLPVEDESLIGLLPVTHEPKTFEQFLPVIQR